MEKLDFEAVIVPEQGAYSSWCPDLDIASQGNTIEEALANLKEAVALYLECLTPAEIAEFRERHGARWVTTMQLSVPA